MLKNSSDKNILNSSGLNIELCGTPNATFTQVLQVISVIILFDSTNCHALDAMLKN